MTDDYFNAKKIWKYILQSFAALQWKTGTPHQHLLSKGERVSASSSRSDEPHRAGNELGTKAENRGAGQPILVVTCHTSTPAVFVTKDWDGGGESANPLSNI